jgi:hypothetical protein
MHYRVEFLYVLNHMSIAYTDTLLSVAVHSGVLYDHTGQKSAYLVFESNNIMYLV